MLYPIAQNGVYGFIREDGSLAVPPQFDSAMTFTEGLAGVKRKKKWGFINEAGDIVIAPHFDSCHGFSHGLALVEEGDSKLYIDSAGEVVIRANFYECRSFEGDLAFVMPDITSRGAFIDRTGQIVLTERVTINSQLSEGLINCREEKLWGYMDRTGELVIPPRYGYARPFHDGLAAATIGKDKKYCFIDPNGNIVIEKKFQGSDIQFSGGLCAVWNKHYGYIDRQGNLAIPYRFYLGQHFAEGMAVIQEPGSDTYGYINEAGEIAVEPKFRSAESYCGPLARVTVGESFESYRDGYINRQGEYVWEPTR